jgi:hypothetical protein
MRVPSYRSNKGNAFLLILILLALITLPRIAGIETGGLCLLLFLFQE